MSFRPEFHSLVAVGLLGFLIGCTSAHPKTTAPEVDSAPVEPEVPEAQGPEGEQDTPEASFDLASLQALALEDPEAALLRLDDALASQPQDGALLLLFADTTMELFFQRQAAGTLGPGLASDLLADALSAYEAALQAGASQESGLVGLIGCYRQLGDPASGWDAALGLFDKISADLEKGQPVAENALLAIGQAGLDQTVAAVSAGDPAPGSAHLAVLALETARAQGDPTCVLPLADLYAWLGDLENQAQILAFGLHQSPNDLVLYGRLQGLGGGDRNRQVGILEQLRLDIPGQATPLWYLGEARYLQGRETRNAADFLKAMECWDRAEESFLQAMALQEDYTETCHAWLHLVRTQRGWTLRDEGRIADAGATFLATLETDPSRLEPAPTAESLHLGIDAIVGDFYNAGQLKDARNLLRKVCAIHDDNSDWTNNLGFFCRDLGVQALADGDEIAARTYFEESWDAYSRTVELSPEEARLVNDRALIAVYYLDEHWELAEQELHRSIELGMKTLAEMGPDVPDSEREYFDMAVGDAWENLAFLYLNRYEEIGESETYIQKSLEHFPFDQRTGIPPLQRKLEALRNP